LICRTEGVVAAKEGTLTVATDVLGWTVAIVTASGATGERRGAADLP
jgi:hypothetical protein